MSGRSSSGCVLALRCAGDGDAATHSTAIVVIHVGSFVEDLIVGV